MAQETGMGHNQEKIPLSQKFACSTGSIFNDLARNMAFSFMLIFLIKVAELSGKEAGLIILMGQIVDSLVGPLVGYCSDKVTLPLLGRLLGRRKAWHVTGVVLMAIVWPLMFTRCLICNDSSQRWLKISYYLIINCLTDVAFPLIDIGHLSIISIVAKDQEECIVLNTLRTMFTYISGICAYAVVWIILGQDSGDGLSADSWKDFTIANCIMAGIGVLFSGVIFHIGTKEPKDIKRDSTLRDFITKSGLLSVAIIFTMGTNDEGDGSFPLRKISAYLLPFDKTTEEAEQIDPPPRRSSSKVRKTSALRKISAYLVPFEARVESPEPDEDSGLENITDVDDAELHRKQSAVREKKISIFKGSDGDDEGCANKGFDGFDTKEDESACHAALGDSQNFNVENGKRRSSLPEKIVLACHEADKKNEKTRLCWMKDPKLYAVSLIYAFTRLIQDVGYSYMPFYLTDYLKFPTEAIAYFPLILLASGVCGTAIVKLLERRLGSKWTYCVSGAVIIIAAVWLYFLKAPKELVYVPIILFGCGMSATFVMALSFVNDLIGDNKETSGFVFSVICIVAQICSGVYFMAVQSFYPTSGETATFARYVFTVSIGVLGVVDCGMVILAQKSQIPSRKRSTGARKRKSTFPENPEVDDKQLQLQENVTFEDTRF